MFDTIQNQFKSRVGNSYYLKSLRVKLILSFAIVFLMTAFSSIASIFAISRVEHKMELMELMEVITQDTLLVRQREKNFLLYGNLQELAEAKNLLAEIRKRISALDQDYLEGFSEITKQMDDYERIINKFLTGQVNSRQDNALKAELREEGHKLMTAIINHANTLNNRLETDVLKYKEMSFLLLWVAIPVGLLLCIFLAEWILQPIDYLRRQVINVMSGKLKHIPVEPVANKCIECDGLVRSINKMLDTIESKQQQLIQSEKLAAIGKVTAGIAHEINNPLNNISLTAEVLLEDMENMTCDERREFINDILVQAERARDIVHHLLQFSRMKKSTFREKVDLAQLVCNTLSLLKNEIKITRTKVKTNVETGKAIVYGNPNQLQQVLVNIILNAVQAMGEGGSLDIDLKIDAEKKKALLTITDYGPGIPDEVLKHILEPFYTTKKDGTGLGLSVSYGIMKEHKGNLRITSAKGQKTEVTIELPLLESNKGEEEGN
ncbi:MAG: hypothetical protein GXO58_04420 [Thermodesulfobacteria bacterium]|nr:hypothetical protein [Thermodesulfobacteriota bacterium]